MEEKTAKKVMLSGIQPSGDLTLGSYLGAIKNWSERAEIFDCYYFMADLHSITVRQNPADLRRRTVEQLAQYIACGLDPEKNTLFIQSHIPAHTQLGWVLNCYTMFGELSRMTQFKDKSAKNAENINGGLFTYPALMAADILLYQPDYIPVGSDQKQHVELCRDVATRFNNIYGDVFKIPEPYIPTVGARVMSLSSPENKMSKSDKDPNGTVYLLDRPEDIMRKFKKAVTDSDTERCVRFDVESKPGVANLMSIYSACTGKTFAQIEAEFEGKGYGAFKPAVGEAVVETLRPIREETERLLKDKAYLESVYKAGAEKASYIANKTLRKVYKKVGFVAKYSLHYWRSILMFLNTAVWIKVMLAILVAFVVSIALTPFVKRLAVKVGAVDVPGEARRVHDHPIPRMGGLAIFLGFIVSTLLFADITQEVRGILIGSIIIVITGVIDDIVSLRAWTKFLIQILAAVIAVLHGVVINVVSNPNVFSNQEAIVLGWVAIPLTVLWIVGITNSVNLIDGLDGLAVGVSTISCVTILVVALLVSEPNVALIVAALAGACIGFMPYNLNPARIFMGDTGSLLLGYVLATVSVLGLFKFYAIVTFVVPVLALAVPLSDTLFAFCRRILHGQSPFHADRGHFHHKLMDLGLNQKQAVAILYAISATLGLAAVVLTTKGTIRIALLILALLIGFVVCAFIRKSVHKHHLDVELQEAKAAAEAETAAAAENTAPVQEGNDEQTH